jgi:hypothetical protein
MLHEHRESRYPPSMQAARAHQEAARKTVNVVVHARVHWHVRHLHGGRGPGGAGTVVLVGRGLDVGGVAGTGGWMSCRWVLSMAG